MILTPYLFVTLGVIVVLAPAQKQHRSLLV